MFDSVITIHKAYIPAKNVEWDINQLMSMNKGK